MRDFRMLFGATRHMARIGEDEKHKELRARNEARLAALKASNRLYEDKSESTSSRHPASNYTAAERARLAANQLIAATNSSVYGSNGLSAFSAGVAGASQLFGLGLGCSPNWPE